MITNLEVIKKDVMAYGYSVGMTAHADYVADICKKSRGLLKDLLTGVFNDLCDTIALGAVLCPTDGISSELLSTSDIERMTEDCIARGFILSYETCEGKLKEISSKLRGPEKDVIDLMRKEMDAASKIVGALRAL